jgi:hypothetical protein
LPWLLEEREGLGIAWIPLENRSYLPDSLVTLTGAQQHRGQMDAERDVVGHCLDSFAQAVENGRIGFHAAVRCGREGQGQRLNQTVRG